MCGVFLPCFTTPSKSQRQRQPPGLLPLRRAGEFETGGAWCRFRNTEDVAIGDGKENPNGDQSLWEDFSSYQSAFFLMPGIFHPGANWIMDIFWCFDVKDEAILIKIGFIAAVICFDPLRSFQKKPFPNLKGF